MFLRIVTESFSRTPRRKLLTAAALSVAMDVATATLTVMLEVGDRLASEFRSLGANLLVTPKADSLPLQVGGVDYRPVDEGAYLPEDDLPQLKRIFWRNNIVGFAPFLDVPISLGTRVTAENKAIEARTTLIGTWVRHPVAIGDGEIFKTGIATTNPSWRLTSGHWFDDSAPDTARPEAVIGASLAARTNFRLGDTLLVRSGNQAAEVTLSGIVSTGGPEDDAVIAPLAFAQKVASRPGKFRRLMVSALTKPEDGFARRDPTSMNAADFDRWYCSAYISSIAYQIGQVLPNVDARPVRRVAETEGKVLTRISALLWLVTIAALVAAGLAVAATAATTVLERQREIGLMKALGASTWLVGAFFLGEQILLAVVGGSVGYAAGIILARRLSLNVFDVASGPHLILLPVAITLAILVAIIGSAVPLGRASQFDPAPILRGE
jgi:putative ABC transport system permease protein